MLEQDNRTSNLSNPDASKSNNLQGSTQSKEQSSSSWRRTYFTIMAGQAVSLVGSSAVQFALMWHLANQTGSPATMGTAGIVGFLPGAILAPVAGIAADRYNRKFLCMGSDLASGVFALLFALAMGSLGTPVWAVMALMGVRSAVSAFQSPAMQSMVPQIVPAESLMEAGGISQVITSASFILGPAVGGFLYTILPLHIILATDLVGALVAVAALALVSVPDYREKVVVGDAAESVQASTVSAQSSTQTHPLTELREGLEVYWQDRRLTLALVCLFFFMLFFMPMGTFYPLMTSDYFDLGAFEGSVVEMTWAAGMLVAGFIFSRITIHNEIRATFWATLAFGVVCFVSGVLPTSYVGWIIFAVLCAIMGATSTAFDVPFVAYLQRSIDPAKLGRAFSAFHIIATAALPLGLAMASPAAEAMGVNAWFVVSGIAISVVGFLMLVLERRLDRSV